MSLTGSFRDLDRLIANLGRMSRPEFAAALSKNVGMSALEQIDQSFAAGVDPWDRPWKPSGRAEREGGQTLRDSGRLQRGMTATSALRASPNGFEVGTNTKYAAIHNYGGEIKPKSKPRLKFRVGKRWVSAAKVVMPKRQFIPEPELSPRWERAFEEAIAAYLEASL